MGGSSANSRSYGEVLQGLIKDALDGGRVGNLHVLRRLRGYTTQLQNGVKEREDYGMCGVLLMASAQREDEVLP